METRRSLGKPGQEQSYLEREHTVQFSPHRSCTGLTHGSPLPLTGNRNHGQQILKTNGRIQYCLLGITLLKITGGDNKTDYQHKTQLE